MVPFVGACSSIKQVEGDTPITVIATVIAIDSMDSIIPAVGKEFNNNLYLLLIEIKDNVNFCGNRVVVRVYVKDILSQAREGSSYFFHLLPRNDLLPVQDNVLPYRGDCHPYYLAEQDKVYQVVRIQKQANKGRQ